MGIKGLRDILKKYAIKGLPWIRLSQFSGQRIAIDVNNRVCVNLYTTYKMILARIKDIPLDGQLDMNMVVNSLISNLATDAIKMLNLGITPIFVFDGMVHPAKEATREKRKGARKNKRDELAALLARRRELRANWESRFRLEEEELIKDIKKIMPQVAYLSDDGYEMIKTWLYLTGLPYITAKYESEKLCALLSCQGQAAAVHSSDGDCLAFGSHCTIYSSFLKVQLSGGVTDYIVQVMDCGTIMQQLQLNFQQILEFCILCGTDFNTNIKSVGPERSFKMIKDYGSIDNAQKYLCTKYDFSVLNLAENKEIFGIIPWQDYVLPDATKSPEEQFCLDLRPWSWDISKQAMIDAHGWDQDLFGIRIYIEQGVKPLHPELLAQAAKIATPIIEGKMLDDQEQAREKYKSKRKVANKVEVNVPILPVDASNNLILSPGEQLAMSQVIQESAPTIQLPVGISF